MQEVVLSSSQPHGWLGIAADKYSASVRILDSKILNRDVVEHLFEMNVRPELADRVLAEVKKDRDVLDMEVVRPRGAGRVYGSISTARCTICREVAASKCFLASVRIDKGTAQWTILGNQESSGELLKSLERKGIPFELRLKRNLDERELLTSRQEQLLSAAFERGYFDFPKKTGLRELAEIAGVKTSTLAEILRRGQKKILQEYFKERRLSRPSRTAEASWS